MKRSLLFALLAAIAATIGCGGASTSNSNTNLSQTGFGAVYVTGEDAPLASVVSFQLTLNSVTLNGQNNKPQVVTNTTVDFARLIGRTPYALTLFLLAAPPGQRALSLHRPARTRRRVRPRRHSRSQARQTPGAARAGHAG